jgi:hypothetical protein
LFPLQLNYLDSQTEFFLDTGVVGTVVGCDGFLFRIERGVKKNDIQNDKKICCNIIDFAQQLLKQQFPSVNGLQFTGYAPILENSGKWTYSLQMTCLLTNRKTVPLACWIERTQWSCPVWWICTEGGVSHVI